ncbi:MAG: hypothetical protein PHQ43_13960 [Dehalococcoidales bacterium]|nr:hypothetical protein [Dehalococcoidales bacterium]
MAKPLIVFIEASPKSLIVFISPGGAEGLALGLTEAEGDWLGLVDGLAEGLAEGLTEGDALAEGDCEGETLGEALGEGEADGD